MLSSRPRLYPVKFIPVLLLPVLSSVIQQCFLSLFIKTSLIYQSEEKAIAYIQKTPLHCFQTQYPIDPPVAERKMLPPEQSYVMFLIPSPLLWDTVLILNCIQCVVTFLCFLCFYFSLDRLKTKLFRSPTAVAVSLWQGQLTQSWAVCLRESNL